VRVAIATPDRRAQERIGDVLRTRGYEIVTCAEQTVTTRLATEFKADVVLVLANNASIKSIRSTQSAVRPYIIALLPSQDAKRLTQAIEAGADDFMMVNALSAEITARVEAPKRIAEWAGDVAPTTDLIRKLGVWQDAPRMLSQEVGAMFGVFTEGNERPTAVPQQAAVITITSPEDDTEVRLLVGVDGPSGDALTQLALGVTGDSAALGDCLRELANSVAGAFKRTALTEGTTVTLGLPKDCDASEVPVAERVWSAESDRFSVVMGLSKGSRESLRLRANELQPGMVLKHDVRTAAGAFLVRAGTELTDRTAKRLVEFCEPTALFDVVEASPALN
jgi:hypothetical protein